MIGSGAHEKILVVDDSPSVIALVRRILMAEGYEVLVATNGAACLEKLPIVRPDLVLLDIMMPGMNGYEACAKIKADDRWRELPVIFFSALATGLDKTRAFDLGAADYVTKPIDSAELVARVRTHLKAAQIRRRELALNEELERGISERTAKIEAALEEKSSLLHEINHRVMNNLQILVALIEQQVEITEDASAGRTLKALQARARTMAFVYQALESDADLSKVRLKPFLDKLVAELSAGRDSSVEVSCDFADETLDIARAMPFALVANELVSNAFTHAFPVAGTSGTIAVRLCASGARYVFTVLDDGVGCPDCAGDEPRSLGLKLVRILAEQLDGMLSVTGGGGTKVEFSFPLPQDGSSP